MKKLLLFGLVFLLLVSFAQAQIVFNDTFNRADSNTVGNGWTQSSDDIDDFVQISSNTLQLVRTNGPTWIDRPEDLTEEDNNITFKVKVSDGTPQSDIMRIQPSSGTGASNSFYLMIYQDKFQIYDGVVKEVGLATSDNTYYTVTVYNMSSITDRFNIKIDGTDYGSFSAAGNVNNLNTRYIHMQPSQNSITITYDWINITNSTPVLPTESQLTASNYFNSSAISHFNATITNSTTTTEIDTINGTVFYPVNQIVNISINSSGYFNRTILNWNTSVNLDIALWQAVVYTYANQSYTDFVLQNFNVTYNSSGTSQTNTSNNNYTIHYLNAGTYNYSAIAEDQNYNSTGGITLTNFQILNHTIHFVPFAVNVSAKEYFTNATITDFTLQVLSDYYNANYTTTTGWVLVYGVNGSYNYTIMNPNYADQSIIYNLTFDGDNYTFFLFTTNSIYFRFYDEVTLELIDGENVTAEIISDVFADNYTTDNGTLYLDLLSPSIYTFRTSAENYDERFYEYGLLNGSNLQIDVYLVNTSTPNYAAVTVTIYDENKDVVENAVVKVLRYDIESNSYTVREIIRTNFQGQAIIDLIKNEEWYKFIIEYGGAVKLTSEKTQIYGDSLSFQINLFGVSGANYFITQGVNGGVVYDNSNR